MSSCATHRENHNMDHRQIAVETVVASRRSIRRFLDTPVSMAEVRDLIIKSSRAPSGTNFQPWKVVVVAGETKRRLSAAVIQDAERGEKSEEYAYAPSPVPEPYLSRRRAVGYGLYNLYGIARDDYVARKAAMLRNFEFFGAPVGLFFTLDRQLTEGSWVDCGMFMQTVMILARARGLDTCAQQAWCEFGGVVHRELGIPDDQILVSGLALGHADPMAPENSLVTDRVAIEEYMNVHE